MTSQFLTVAVAVSLSGCLDSASSGYTRLMRASASGEAGSVRELLDGGADPNAADGKGETALSLAAQFGRTDVVALLLKGGAQVDAADRKGITPLMKAAGFGQEETVEALLRGGADRTRRDLENRDAAAWARSSGHESLARRLE
jgi:ankyrin repeat protein